MKKQCNLCGLREDLPELISNNKTWCLLHNNEVDNKYHCEYWHPDVPSITSQSLNIVDKIKNNIKPVNDQEEKRVDITLKYLPSSKSIWDAIKTDYGISKKHFGVKIFFVSDKFMRKIIFRDVEQAYELAVTGYSKPAVILAGSVLEELLRQYLEYKKIKPTNDSFDEYIKACKANDLLKSAIHSMADSIRHFRNFVHLSKEKTPKHKISKATAKGAVASIFTVANDFEK